MDEEKSINPSAISICGGMKNCKDRSYEAIKEDCRKCFEEASEAIEWADQLRGQPKVINSVRVLPWFYAQMFPWLSHTAKEHGYALAVHGSMKRDFDLIAIPWTEKASDTLVFVEAFRVACNGIIDNKKDYPGPKPHGRWTWAIQLGAGCYIDLSVMPIYKQGNPINWEDEELKRKYPKMFQ
jgi:hypothetical protein